MVGNLLKYIKLLCKLDTEIDGNAFANEIRKSPAK